MNNGSGLRVVLWLSGCEHHCKGCQNPQTWNPDSGIEFDLAAKEEIFEQLNKDYISGITFSGGDPLHKNNIHEVYKLCNEICTNHPTKTIWLYTGFTWEDCIMKQGEIVHSHNGEKFMRSLVIELCDVLVDGRYDESKRNVSLPWVGSSNQRVINVQQSLSKGEIILWNPDMY
jgi:anaerobic ribonucleoside-triphosphate reductase activating protein